MKKNFKFIYFVIIATFISWIYIQGLYSFSLKLDIIFRTIIYTFGVGCWMIFVNFFIYNQLKLLCNKKQIIIVSLFFIIIASSLLFTLNTLNTFNF